MPHEPLTPPWAYYQRKGLSEMRPYVPGENLSGISVSEPDKNRLAYCRDEGIDPGGYIARNPKNHADQWYVAQAYFDENLEPVSGRDNTTELIEAALEWAEAKRVFDDGHYDSEDDFSGVRLSQDEALRRLEQAEDRLRSLGALRHAEAALAAYEASRK